MRLIILDGVRYLLNCSQEVFHKLLPAIKSDIQLMYDSQPGDQKWFNREDLYKISHKFGQDQVIVFGEEVGKGKGKLKREDWYEYMYPVPVYELASTPVSGYPVVDRFWICLDTSWDHPAISQVCDPFPPGDRSLINIKQVRFDEVVVFPLNRIALNTFEGYDDWNYESDDDYIEGNWTGGTPKADVIDLLEPAGPWYGPNLSGTYGLAGTSAIIKPCDVDGAILRSDTLATPVDYLPAGSFTVWGPFSKEEFYAFQFYDYDVTYGYIISYMDYLMPGLCPFVNHEETVVTAVSAYQVVGPITRHDYANTRESNVLMLGNIVVGSSAYEISKTVDFTARLIRSTPTDDLDVEGVLGQQISGNSIWHLNDAVTLGVEGWEDYQAWCVVFELNEYNNNSMQDTIYPWDYGEAYDLNIPEYTPYTQKIVIRVAGRTEDFVIYENTHANMNLEDTVYCHHCEIYDFYGEPVYIIMCSVISATVGENGYYPGFNIYAMIYRDEVIVSDQFLMDQSISNPYTYRAPIYESVNNWSRYGYTYARAAGVNKERSSSDTIILEE